MTSKLHRQVLETIRRYRMVSPGDRIGVAVSGGADSTTLLCLLEELGEGLGVTLRVLHLNHGLRGAESDEDERFVGELARAGGLELISERTDVAAEARRNGWNLEDAGRRVRYRFFERIVEEGGATRVAVAHTADDQAETVLARLLRGTGPRGLAGIYPVMGSVVRPLLDIRRGQLREYLAQRGQIWREDRSNLDERRLRARLRHRLLPLLEKEYQPAVVKHLASLAALARDDEEYWRTLLEAVLQGKVKKAEDGLSIQAADLFSPLTPGQIFGGTSGAPRLDLPDRDLAPESFQKRIVRRIVEELAVHPSQLTSEHLDEVMRLAKQRSCGRRIELPGGLVVEKTLDYHLRFFHRPAETRQVPESYEYIVDLQDRGQADIAVPEISRRFCLKLIDWPWTERDTKSEGEALDADLLRAPLVLRNWRPGDAYRPRGRRQVRKLKELFLRSRIPVRERSRWPVLTSAGQLVWVKGMPPAEEFAARQGTRNGLVIQEASL